MSYQLKGKNGLFGRKYQSLEQAEEAKQFYIREHTKDKSFLVEREYRENGMRLLHKECEDIAAAFMQAEITVIKA
jgi:hypothetical protein